MNKAAFLLLTLAFTVPLAAQRGGFLAGSVRDRSGIALAGAEVRIQSESTGARQQVSCDGQGRYFSSELPAGTYKITVRNDGFRTVSKTEIIVAAGRTRAADFEIEILPVTQEVTVRSAQDDSDPTANGIAVSREASANALPANGRDLHAFFGLMPGASIAPAAASDGGQFTVLGQRPNTNSFRIDGVNGNTGIGLSATPGTFPGSTLPSMTVIGSTQSLAAKDEMERVDMRSADFAPQYGERPGAQVLIETRAGSNAFHASGFGYTRPKSLDSEDWFAQKYSTGLAPSSLSGYGGSMGGSLWPDHTSFFTAFEDANVNDRALQIMATPSWAARANAPDSYKLLLDLFPSPATPSVNANEALSGVSLQNRAEIKNYSTRVDQIVSERARLFARYASVPSESTTQQLETHTTRFSWMSATLASTFETRGLINDLRFNYSYVRATSSWSGAALTNSLFSALPSFERPVDALSIPGVGQLLSGWGDDSAQRQWEGSYTAARQFGRHDVRLGLDFVELLPTTADRNSATTSIVADNLRTLVSGNPVNITIGSRSQIGKGSIPIGSLFLQDTYKLSKSLSIVYGVRWEITPPIHSISGTSFTFGSWNGVGSGFSPSLGLTGNNQAAWPMRYGQVAPRLGLAYHLSKPDVVLRLGAGVFYDNALGSLINPVNLTPLSWSFTTGQSTAASQPAGQSALYGQNLITYLNDIDHLTPTLFLPKVWEWRASIERAVGEGSTLSLSYAGSAGRRLLREETLLGQQSQALEGFAFTSTGRSDYAAFEAQYRGQITQRLYTLFSYTWAHSIDTGSQTSSIFWNGTGYPDAANRGSSSFDLRHNLSASAVYRLPDWQGQGRPFLRGWNLSSTLAARTGFPFDVTTVDRSVGLGYENTGRPDLLEGVPLWIHNSAAPNGRALNPAAFRTPANGAVGTLGRSVLNGPGLFQVDASLRRQFRLYRASILEANISAFNLFNRASFANPVAYLGSALFGQPASMQSLMLGTGTPNSGLTPVFQQGGPRTVEIGLKVRF